MKTNPMSKMLKKNREGRKKVSLVMFRDTQKNSSSNGFWKTIVLYSDRKKKRRIM